MVRMVGKLSRKSSIEFIGQFGVSVGSIALLIAGCAGNSTIAPQYLLSINRLKAVNSAMLIYANDNDGTLPQPDVWMDSMIPYTKDDQLYHSPSVGSRGYGYALNNLLSGKSVTSFASPTTTVDLFDSTNLSRNATVSTTTLPRPPRYGTHNTIAFLDGHVQDEQITVTKPDLYAESQTHLRSVTLGMLMYANDYDGGLPLKDQYVDELLPYAKNLSLFRSPAIENRNQNAFGYAFSIDLVGINQANIATPATTIALFDSTVLKRNATEPLTTLPKPPRYGKLNTIAYADGHLAK